jgi:WXG100 family type VII secretion target
MARGQIVVESTRLDSTAAQVDGLADTYNTNYLNLFNAVQELQNAWSGKDNVSFTNQIEGFRDDFQRMEKLMRDYADYLRKVAASYRQVQENVESSAKTLSQGS